MIKKIIKFFYKKFLWFYACFDKFIANTRPYGFSGLSIKEVGVKFIKALTTFSVNSRASAVAFCFFLAMFPAIIFVFTVIPYLPIEDFSDKLMDFMSGIMPDYAFDTIESTIEDITTRKNASLLSFGFIASLYFAKSGFATMISTFNETVNATEKRSWIKVEIISLSLVLIIVFFMSITIGLITFSDTIFYFLQDNIEKMSSVIEYLYKSAHWILSISFFYFAVAVLYYLAPTKKDRFKFFSLGAAISTILCILLVIVFSYYINNFGTYNKLYGSIGTLIALLVWIRFTALILIIGFELNASIKRTQIEINSKKNNILINK
jgi:membrane protein